jgi:hypothetical protein
MNEQSGAVRCPVCQHDRFRHSRMPRAPSREGTSFVISEDRYPFNLATCLLCSHVLFFHSTGERPIVVFHDDGRVEWYEG